MLKKFIVNVHLNGYYTEEDPHCPPSWRGSHCYDINVPCYADLKVEVWAETEDQAIKFAEEHDYDKDPGNWNYVEEIDFVSVDSVEDLPDRDTEEAGVIEPVEYKWKEIEKDW